MTNGITGSGAAFPYIPAGTPGLPQRASDLTQETFSTFDNLALATAGDLMTTYDLDDNGLSQEEFTTLAIKTFGMSEEDASKQMNYIFADVKRNRNEEYLVDWMVGHDLLDGTLDGTITPENVSVSSDFAQASTMIETDEGQAAINTAAERIQGLLGNETSTLSSSEFYDFAVEHWGISRAQAATILESTLGTDITVAQIAEKDVFVNLLDGRLHPDGTPALANFIKYIGVLGPQNQLWQTALEEFRRNIGQ